MIAAFITFMGANNSGEQARKARLPRARHRGRHRHRRRCSCTPSATTPTASIAVILVALFFGFYLMRINYAFMVVGITVMVSQLYVQLDEFSNSLLLLRLEETAIGAAWPSPSSSGAAAAHPAGPARRHARPRRSAVATLVDHATSRLLGEDPRR